MNHQTCAMCMCISWKLDLRIQISQNYNIRIIIIYSDTGTIRRYHFVAKLFWVINKKRTVH
jgi:hypothetical protein